LSGNLEQAVDHLTIAILLNLSSGIKCFPCYDGCIDHGIGWTQLPQPWRLKWQVIPKAPFTSCCDFLFSDRVDALCLGHRAVELLGIVGAFLVLELQLTGC
jgi:hypothetical protein